MLEVIAWSKLVCVALTDQGVAASASVSSLLNGAGILYKINYLFFLLRLRDLCEEELKTFKSVLSSWLSVVSFYPRYHLLKWSPAARIRYTD